jgi:hypothetical protein
LSTDAFQLIFKLNIKFNFFIIHRTVGIFILMSNIGSEGRKRAEPCRLRRLISVRLYTAGLASCTAPSPCLGSRAVTVTWHQGPVTSTTKYHGNSSQPIAP